VFGIGVSPISVVQETIILQTEGGAVAVALALVLGKAVRQRSSFQKPRKAVT
jgi:hypothetical protein